MSFGPLPFDFPTVERVSCASARDRERLERGGRPVVISGSMDQWPLLETLQARTSDASRLETLAELAGRTRVGVTIVPEAQKGQLGYRAASTKRNYSFRSRRMTLTELLPLLGHRDRKMFYMQSAPAGRFPSLCAQTRPLPFLAGRQSNRCRLWVGSGGQVVNLHLDPYDNMLCMLAGVKRVTLFPPHVLPYLYPAPPDRGLGGTPSSLVRLLELDRRTFPLVDRALPEGVVARVEPGDVLWIPPFWWHHVESDGLNVMLNNWLYRFDVHRWQQVLTSLVSAFPVLGVMTADERMRHRALLADLVRETKADASSRLAADAAPAARRLLSDMAAVQRSLTPEFRTIANLFFDYFAFQVEGPPFATIPGELARTIQRCRWKRWLAPAVFAVYRRVVLGRERFSLVPGDTAVGV